VQSSVGRPPMELPEWVDNTPLRCFPLLLQPSRYCELVGRPLQARGLTKCIDEQPGVTITAPISPQLFAQHLRALLAQYHASTAAPPLTPGAFAAASTAPSVVDGTVVDIIGFSRVAHEMGCPHIEFIVLTCLQPRAEMLTKQDAKAEAHLVQRRYRDFERLHSLLYRRAERAGLTMPPLPPKTWTRDVSCAFSAERQAALHAWLTWVLQHQLWCDALCLFLGVGEQAAARAITLPVVSASLVAVGAEPVDSPQLLLEARAVTEWALDSRASTACESRPWAHPGSASGRRHCRTPSLGSLSAGSSEWASEAPTRPSSAMAIPLTSTAALLDGSREESGDGEQSLSQLSTSPAASSAGYMTAEEG